MGQLSPTVKTWLLVVFSLAFGSWQAERDGSRSYTRRMRVTWMGVGGEGGDQGGWKKGLYTDSCRLASVFVCLVYYN